MKTEIQDELHNAWKQFIDTLLEPIMPYIEKFLQWLSEVMK